MKFCPVCGKEYADGKVCDTDGAILVQPKPVRVDDLLGKVLKESYRIDEKIGEGGMGAVFRGVQIVLQRNVAIKVLTPGLQSTPSIIQRFFREARLLSQLSHPNVVGIIDFGHTEDGMVYMVMEHLIGSTLTDIVPAGEGLDAQRIVAFMLQICSGVASAHRRMLVHRDLKPDNIFVTQSTGEESVKILDFGIARALESEGQPRLTQKGMLMGTPGFLAPEQIQSLDADARSDTYALGALLCFMITGRRPYGGDTPHAIFAQQLHRPPEIDEAAFGDRLPLAEVVLKAMSIDSDERYQSAAELAEALESVAIAEGLIDPPSRTITTPGRTWTPQELEQHAPDPERLVPTPVMAPPPSRPAADPRPVKTPVPASDAMNDAGAGIETTQMLREGSSSSPAHRPWLPWAAVGLIVVAILVVLLL